MCSNPPNVANAMFTPTAPFNVDDEVTYACDAGFELQGDAVLICQNTGVFLPFPPTCIRGKKSSSCFGHDG